MKPLPRIFTGTLAVLATACLGLASPASAQWGGYGGGGTAPKNQFNIMMNYELGMHCTGFEFAYCCVLPPYNSILAQVVKTGKGGSDFPALLEADPNVGLDGLGRPTVLRDNFNKYVLRYWHDAQPRSSQPNNPSGSAPQTSTLISLVEGNSLLMWNTLADGAVVDAGGALTFGTTDGSDNVIQGDGDLADANDNYWNAIWNHLYIYVNEDGNPNLEGHNATADVSAEGDKIRLGIQVLYPENTGAALHPMGPGVVGAGFGNVLTFSGDTGTVVYTQMKVLENLPVMLTSPRIWEALGLPLTPFEDTINFFADPGAVDEQTIRPYVRMRAQLHNYDPNAPFGIGSAVLDGGNPVIGFGTAPIDIPNCERCHSLGPDASENSAQKNYPLGDLAGVSEAVQEEIDFWNAYYGIGDGDSDWYSRLKGAAISILKIHDVEHGTHFADNWPYVEGAAVPPECTAGDPSKIGDACTNNSDCDGSACTAGDPSKIGDPCTNNGDCDSAGAMICTAGSSYRLGDPCSSDSDCGYRGQCTPVSGMVCTSGYSSRIGDPCTRDGDCGGEHGRCEDVGSGGNDGVCGLAGDGVCAAAGSGDPHATRLGHGSVMCQRCHADNVIAVVKSADCGPGQNCDPNAPRNELWSNITGTTLIKPLTEALHNNHKDNPFSDSLGRSGGCQGCHPAHRSDGDMSGYPITELGLNAFGGSDNRDAAGGCFVGRDVHSNPGKDSDGAETPQHLNAVGQWLSTNVFRDDPDPGDVKGIWCTNCHSQLGQEIWKTENCPDLIHGDCITNPRGEPTLADVAAAVGISEAQAIAWLDPKTDDDMAAIWNEDPGICDHAASLLFPVAVSPYQDGNVATIEINLESAANCSAGTVGVPGPDCGTNPGNPSFWICVKTDVDGDVNVNLLDFCTTADCVAAAQATLTTSGAAAVPVPMSAATDGRDHWLAPGEPHCADCHAAPYVEQSGNITPYPPFNYPRKASLFRYTRGHRDITCQGCHESIHGLYPVTPNIDTTSYAQAASMNTDGSHGPLKCGACHAADSNGVLSWADDLSYQGTKIKDSFDKAVSWMHTATDEADPRADICKNCHGDKADEIRSSGGWGGSSGEWDSEWLKHTMKDRVSRNTMDKVEIAEIGHVAGDPAFENPLTTVCRGCHGDESHEVSCGESEWKAHLTEGRVSPSVWEYVALQEGGSTCGY